MAGAEHARTPIDVRDVRRFWQENPVAAAAVPHAPGSAAFFEYYDRLREQNEPSAFSRWLHEYDRFAGRRVLDVGCGNGYVLSRYASAGARTTGVDLTTAALDLSRTRYSLAGLEGAFVHASAEQLPFADGSFDCVCSMGVLHHTPDTARAVAEIWRVLAPGGRLIVMFYHRNSVLYRFTFPLARLRTGKSVRQLVDEVDGVGNPKGDVYSRRQLASLLARFEAVEFEVGLLQRWMLPWRLQRLVPQDWLARMAGRWGWFLYAKARKPALALPAGLAPPGAAPRRATEAC
jgi:SAM-dependent methyltransferase